MATYGDCSRTLWSFVLFLSVGLINMLLACLFNGSDVKMADSDPIVIQAAISTYQLLYLKFSDVTFSLFTKRQMMWRRLFCICKNLRIRSINSMFSQNAQNY